MFGSHREVYRATGHGLRKAGHLCEGHILRTMRQNLGRQVVCEVARRPPIANAIVPPARKSSQLSYHPSSPRKVETGRHIWFVGEAARKPSGLYLRAAAIDSQFGTGSESRVKGKKDQGLGDLFRTADPLHRDD